jgi:hypothetical protein
VEAKKVYNPYHMSDEDWPSQETKNIAFKIIHEFQEAKRSEHSIDTESHTQSRIGKSTPSMFELVKTNKELLFN